jgi:hypothetical protein
MHFECEENIKLGIARLVVLFRCFLVMPEKNARIGDAFLNLITFTGSM